MIDNVRRSQVKTHVDEYHPFSLGRDHSLRLTLLQASGSSQYQSQGSLSGGRGEDTWSVAHADPSLLAQGHVDVVQANRECADHLKLRTCEADIKRRISNSTLFNTIHWRQLRS